MPSLRELIELASSGGPAEEVPMAAAGRAGRSSDLSGLIASCVDNCSSLWPPEYDMPRRGERCEIHTMSSASAQAAITNRRPAILWFLHQCVQDNAPNSHQPKQRRHLPTSPRLPARTSRRHRARALPLQKPTSPREAENAHQLEEDVDAPHATQPAQQPVA